MVKRQRTVMSNSTGLSHRICSSFIQSKQCAHGAIMCMLLLENTIQTVVYKLKLMGRGICCSWWTGHVRQWEAFQTRAAWPEMPSFYLSAGLRPVGTDRREGTGRRHSRTLASSRTSRAEAERSPLPAGRRLTGSRGSPSARVFHESTVALMCAVDAFKLNDNLFSRVYLNGLVAKTIYLLNVLPQQTQKQVSLASRCYFSIYLMV